MSDKTKTSETRASYTDMRPSSSRLKGVVENSGINQEPITVDEDRPVSFVKNPNEIIPHDEIDSDLRKSIIDTYGEEFFYEQEWSRGQLMRLHRAISYPRENISMAIAQVCSPKCPMIDTCPYDIAGKPPIGERCPIELKLAQHFYQAYSDVIAERLRIPIEDLREDVILNNFVNSLVEYDIIDMRLNHHIALDGLITEAPAVVNQETNEVYYKDEESVSIRIKERVARRKEVVLKQLLATPEMAAKYKSKASEDSLARHSDLVDKLESMVKQLETTNKGSDAQETD